jgi:membrane-bound lytic murein transglycosylase D
MAPGNYSDGHQLRGPAIGFQRIAGKALLLLCLFLASCATSTNTRVDLHERSWGKLSEMSNAHERSIHGDTSVIESLTSPARQLEISPVGKPIIRSDIQVPDDPAVTKYLGFYKGEGRLTFIDGLERSWLHLPIMVRILGANGLPVDLVYVVLVESSFETKATAPGDTVGYWQLLGSTARSLGLRVDGWVDERMDPIKSTEAAAKYLRLLYDRYESWPLALAAYNAGDVPVRNAIRSCGTTDFWTIRKTGSLPRITRAYVPKILAAIKIARELEHHDFEVPRYLPAFEYDSTYVKSPLNLQEVARWVNATVTELRLLNPSLKRDCLPPDQGFALRLPAGTKKKFLLAYEAHIKG